MWQLPPVSHVKKPAVAPAPPQDQARTVAYLRAAIGTAHDHLCAEDVQMTDGVVAALAVLEVAYLETRP